MVIREELKSVAFRADASLQIGTGHVMRCLTLADALKASGAVCRFICREHPGHLLDLIHDRGYEAIVLPAESENYAPRSEVTREPEIEHGNWLGTDWSTDAEQTRIALGSNKVDWLIVDHYALDTRWESSLRPECRKLMVIDDLADRPHDSDLLLDQNLGRMATDYVDRVPEHCTVLVGPSFALLRKEFVLLHNKAMVKRKRYQGINNILVFLGGTDPENFTGEVLNALAGVSWPQLPTINVVIGGRARHLEKIKDQAKNHPLQVYVLTGVDNMAEIMLDADLAIGAGGTTSWERCALGLPSLITVIAENQRTIVKMLEKSGAVKIWRNSYDLQQCLYQLLEFPAKWEKMRNSSIEITDGLGCGRIVDALRNGFFH